MTFNKMAIVPYQQYIRLKEKKKDPPITNTITSNEEKVMSLDKEMKDILENEKLNDIDKMNKYTEVMSKYIQYKDKMQYDTSTPLPRDDTDNNLKEDDSVVLDTQNDTKNNGEKVSGFIDTKQGDTNSFKTPLKKIMPCKMSKKNEGKEMRSKVVLDDLITKWIHI